MTLDSFPPLALERPTKICCPESAHSSSAVAISRSRLWVEVGICRVCRAARHARRGVDAVAVSQGHQK
jgi:hypothetical protein